MFKSHSSWNLKVAPATRLRNCKMLVEFMIPFELPPTVYRYHSRALIPTGVAACFFMTLRGTR